MSSMSNLIDNPFILAIKRITLYSATKKEAEAEDLIGKDLFLLLETCFKCNLFLFSWLLTNQKLLGAVCKRHLTTFYQNL